MRLLKDDIEELHACLNLFFDALDLAIGLNSRYRVYVVDLEDACYRGLLSRGMHFAYDNAFDVNRPEQYGKTEPLPRFHPQYELIPHTLCYMLSHEAVQKLPVEDQRFFTELLGFASKIWTSYTWEFTADGVAHVPYSYPDAERDRYVGAFSVDAAEHGSQEHRGLHPVAIYWLDALLTSRIGSDLAAGIAGLQGAFAVKRAAPLIRQPRAMEGILTLQAPFQAIPAGDEGEPWVYARGDSACEQVYNLYDSFRNSNDPIVLEGGSGTGKANLARAIHYHSYRRAGRFIEVNMPTWDTGLTPGQELGTTKAAFTAAGSTEETSVFELARDGTCFLDEIYKASRAVMDRMRQTLAALGQGFDLIKYGPGESEDKRYRSNARLISAGDPTERQPWFEGHAARRLEVLRIPIPGWLQVARETKVVRVRWFMMRALRDGYFDSGRLSAALFEFLVDGEPEVLQHQDVGGLKNLWSSLERLAPNGVFTLAPLLCQLQTEDRRVACKLTSSGKDGVFPAELQLGRGSLFEQQLDPFESLVVQIATCATQTGESGGCHGCVAAPALAAALDTPATASRPVFMERLYLLLAAVHAKRTKHPDHDLNGTGPDALYAHFKESGMEAKYRDSFAGIMGCQPGALTKRGENSAEHSEAQAFQEYLEQPAVAQRILGGVERISCAFPPFPVTVPYWRKWRLGQRIWQPSPRRTGEHESNQDRSAPARRGAAGRGAEKQ